MDLFLRITRLGPHNVQAIARDLMRYRRHTTQVTRDLAGLQVEWERLVSNRLAALVRRLPCFAIAFSCRVQKLVDDLSLSLRSVACSASIAALSGWLGSSGRRASLRREILYRLNNPFGVRPVQMGTYGEA